MKILNLALTILLLLIAGVSNSQITEDWSRKFSTSQQSIQESYDAVTDNNGNVYVVGKTSLGYSGSDMALIKYSSAGNYVWGKTFHSKPGEYTNDEAYSLVLYKSGDSTFIYTSIVGTFGGRMWILKYNQNGVLIWKKDLFVSFTFLSKSVMYADASGNCYTAGSNGGDAYIIKYNSAGTFQYHILFANPSGYNIGEWKAITADASGNILVTGKIDSVKSKYITAKYTSGGILLWSKMFKGAGNQNSIANDIAVGASGNVYVTGEYDSGTRDYFTIKYNGATGDTLWTRKFNGTANVNDFGKCIEVDASENVFVTGLTNRASNGSIATLKYNSSGALLWTRTYSGFSTLQDEPSDMALDASGNIIIAGVCDSSSAENTLAIKYNTSGDSLWVKNYSFNSDDYERPAAIHLDNSSNIILTGYCANSDQRDFATLKYNSSGVLQWAKVFTGAQLVRDNVNSITTDKQGNVYTIGKYQTNYGENILIAKYNSLGALNWSFETGIAMYDEGVDLKIDSNGFVYYTATTTPSSFSKPDISYGKLSSTGGSYYYYNLGFEFEEVPTASELDISGNFYITGKSINAGVSSFITCKISPAGNLLWSKLYGDNFAGEDIPKSITVDPSGNVYVSGTSDTTGSNSDIVTLKYNSSGDLQWSRRVNGSANADDLAANILTDKGGNVYVGGTKNETVGGEMGVVLKYNPSGALRWTRTINLNPSTGAELLVTIRLDTSKTKIFAAGHSLITGLLNLDYAIAKFDSAGNQIYQNTFDNTGTLFDQCAGLAVDKNENAYLTGTTYSGSGDILTVCFDQAGNFKGSNIFNGSSNLEDIITGHNPIAVDLNGNVFVAGSSYDTVYGSMMTTIKYKPQTAFTLNLTAFIQGFYNPSSNSMVSDTVKVQLRNSSSPYGLVDSSKGILNSSGAGNFSFSNSVNGINYYIVVRHRNSIETWSAAGNAFVSGAMNYNFSSSASAAFGNNQIQADASPVRFAVYSGDVNQDGTVDISDNQLIDNDSYNFIFGYVNTDLNGDGTVDISDAAIGDNNAFNFVSVVKP